MELTAGTVVRARQLTDVTGGAVSLPDPGALVHLQFRRFAGCPVCSLHLRSFTRRHAELDAAGLREVVVFHSPAGQLRPQVAGLPFTAIADPGKRLYAEFGVGSAARALLDPRAWPAIAAGIAASLWQLAAHRRPAPALIPHGGRLGLPADFLIGRDGRLLAVKYGQHADDHWQVSEVIGLARQHRELAGQPMPATTGR
jgi:peroxiredoxin